MKFLLRWLLTLVLFGLSAPFVAAADMFDLLMNPPSVSQIRDGLRGPTLIDIESAEFPNESDARFIAFLLGQSASGCGFSPTFESRSVGRTVWFGSISEPTATTTELALRSAFAKYNVDVDASVSDLASDLSVRLSESGFAAVKVFDSKQNASVLVYLFDEKLMEEYPHQTTYFLVFNGIAGLEPQGRPNDDNRYSYLFGGGGLRDLAGTERSASRLCHAALVVQGLCNGTSAASIANTLNLIESQCANGASGERTGASRLGT